MGQEASKLKDERGWKKGWKEAGKRMKTAGKKDGRGWKRGWKSLERIEMAGKKDGKKDRGVR
jgi:hypothetical protein